MITITHQLDPGGVQFVIEDEGPGIAAADVPHVFERFYRGSEAQRHTPGTGMGLAIVQGLLHAQGGRVWVGEGLTRGARVSIFVPASHRAGEAE